MWKTAPGGNAFIEENRSTVNGEPTSDYAAMWWNSKAQKVHGIWCDAAINDEGCSAFGVTFEGKNAVLRGQWEYQPSYRLGERFQLHRRGVDPDPLHRRAGERVEAGEYGPGDEAMT